MEGFLSSLKALGSGVTRGLVLVAMFVVYGVGAIGGYALSVAGVTGATMALTSTPAQARRHRRRRRVRRGNRWYWDWYWWDGPVIYRGHHRHRRGRRRRR